MATSKRTIISVKSGFLLQENKTFREQITIIQNPQEGKRTLNFQHSSVLFLTNKLLLFGNTPSRSTNPARTMGRGYLPVCLGLKRRLNGLDHILI